MLRKLMIRTWFGPLPPWTEQFKAHVERLKEFGWDFLIWNDFEEFRKRVELGTGVLIPEKLDTRKAGDYDPYNAVIFPDLIKGYDYWGHFNLDCVYGRLEKWIPDAFLENCDIFANDPGQICGPFSVYRNCPNINELFKWGDPDVWRNNLKQGAFQGYDEIAFNTQVREAVALGHITAGWGFFQSHDHMTRGHASYPHVVIQKDGAILDLLQDREVMMYHFNQTRKWPVI
jgi:hypothetical protein